MARQVLHAGACGGGLNTALSLRAILASYLWVEVAVEVPGKVSRGPFFVRIVGMRLARLGIFSRWLFHVTV